MKRITLYNDHLEFSFPYDYDLKEKVKGISPACSFDGTNRVWRLPVSAIQVDTIANLDKLVTDHQFNVPDMVKDRLKTVREEREAFKKLATASNHEMDLSDIYLADGITLRPYQKAGVEFLIRSKVAILGYVMRLGKSLTAGVAIKKQRAFPLLVVTTASTKLHWQNEFTNKLLVTNCHVLNGKSEYELPEADVYIINYAILPDHVYALKKINFKSIIVDEIHNFGSKSKKPAGKDAYGRSRHNRYSALYDLTKNIEIKYGLTGTLFRNNIKELANILDVMGIMSEKLGMNSWKFLHTFTHAEHTGWGWKFSGGKNLDQLNELLVASGTFLRKTKEDVLTELPKVQTTILPVEISNRREYKQLENGIRVLLNTGKHPLPDDDLEFLGASTEDLRKKYGGTNARIEYIREVIKQLTLLRECVGRGKVESAIEWIEDFLRETDERLVVFAHHKSVQQALLQHFKGACSILAEYSPEKREEERQKFSNNRLIICSLKAAGEGISLAAANTVLHTEYWWNPAIMDQASARVEEVGKLDPINIYYLSAENSIDQYSEAVIAEKRILTTAVSESNATINNLNRLVKYFAS